MKLTDVAIILATFSTVVNSDCSEFENEWKVCPDDMYPNGRIPDSECAYNIHTFAKVFVIHGTDKRSSVYCQNQTFPDGIFDCLPLQNSSRFVLTDCPFRQNLFDKYFQNSSLDELIIRNKNSSVLYPSIHLHHLPRFRLLSLVNIRTFSHFDLRLYSLPHMTSIKILNFTFNGLPSKPFEKLPKLKGLSITKGMLENLPDDFLNLPNGSSIVKLDLSVNKLKNFQPRLLGSMNSLKRLNLSHNLLEAIDGNLFRNTHALEEIIFSYNRIKSLPSRLYGTTPAIKYLFLDHNAMREIPGDIFQGLQQLLILKLSHNNLNFLPPNILNDATSLASLQLQFNQLRTVPTNVLPSPSALQAIDLSSNKIKAFSSSAPFGNSYSLRKINMSGNYLEEFASVNWSLYKFVQLDLSNNIIQELTIPISNASGRGYIFLENNKIRSVTVTSTGRSNYKYFLSGNPFNCNCSLTNFISSLANVADADKLTCEEPWKVAGKHITEFENNTQLCETEDDCPIGCKCRFLPNEQVQVDCRGTTINSIPIRLPHNTTRLLLQNNHITSLTSLTDETWSSLTHLYLSKNSLTSLEGWSVPARLKLLAVDGNNLNELPSSVLDKVSESEDFSIYLKGNDWPCDCQGVFRNWFVENLNKVADVNETHCKLHGTVDRIPLAQVACSSPQVQPNRGLSVFTSIRVILYCLFVSLNKI